MVLDWTGLMRGGEMMSSSLLFGAEAVLLELERFPAGRILVEPGCELLDALVEGRAMLGLVVTASRPLGVRAGTPVVLAAATAALGAMVDEACRICLVGMGGGAMDARPAVTDGRGRAPGVGFALDGVVVREGAPLDGAVPSCLVGDLVGDLIPLGVRDGFWPGVGLGAFRLIRLVKAGSAGVEPREEADENKLLGRAVFLAGWGMNGAAG